MPLPGCCGPVCPMTRPRSVPPSEGRGTPTQFGNPLSPRPALPPSPQGTRGICHPAQESLGWHRGPSRLYHVHRCQHVLLICFLLLQLLQRLEQHLSAQKGTHDTTAGLELLLGHTPGAGSTPCSPYPKTSRKGTWNWHRAVSGSAGRQIPCGPLPGVCLGDALSPQDFQPHTSIAFCFC